MSVEEKKTIFNRWLEEGLSKGNVAVADEAMTSDFVYHSPNFDDLDLEGFKQLATDFFSAFPEQLCIAQQNEGTAAFSVPADIQAKAYLTSASPKKKIEQDNVTVSFGFIIQMTNAYFSYRKPLKEKHR